MPSFEELRSFAAVHEPTRVWIESIKDEVIEELKPIGGHVLLMRSMLEDLLVCGVACLDGDELVDVGTIRLLLDDTGKQPLPPTPAYERVVGDIRTLLTADRLKYIRLRGEGVYPSSPVEKVIELKEQVRRVFLHMNERI